jgi:hypothetical protein
LGHEPDGDHTQRCQAGKPRQPARSFLPRRITISATDKFLGRVDYALKEGAAA